MEGQFEAEGEGASNIAYRVKIVTHPSDAEIRDFEQHTDI